MSIFEKYPLHVACWKNAPISVIQALLKAWPGALQTPAAICLPLHEACACARSLDTIQMLVEEELKSIEHYLPLHLALGICARERPEVSLDIIQFLVHQWPESVKVSHKRVNVEECALVHHQPDNITPYFVPQQPAPSRTVMTVVLPPYTMHVNIVSLYPQFNSWLNSGLKLLGSRPRVKYL